MKDWTCIHYRLGPMTGEQFLNQILEPISKKVGTEIPYGMMSTLKRYMNKDCGFGTTSKYGWHCFGVFQTVIYF